MEPETQDGSTTAVYELGFVLAALFFAVLVFVGALGLFGGNPFAWPPGIIFLATTTVLFIAFVVGIYRDTENRLDAWLKASFDLTPLPKPSSIPTAYLSHLAGLAVAGLILSLAKYWFECNPGFLLAILTAVVTFVAFFVYAIALAQFAIKIHHLDKKALFLIALVVVFIDALAIKFFIATGASTACS